MRSARNKKADKLIDLSATAAQILAAAFRTRVEDLLAARESFSLAGVTADFERLISFFGNELDAALYNSIVAGYVVGAAGVVAPIAAGGNLPPGPPPFDPRVAIFPAGESGLHFPTIENAIEQLQAANVLDAPTYYRMAGQARQEAFTVTANVKAETLDRVRQVLADNLVDTSNRSAFMETIRAEIPEMAISDAHLEQVFRNNVNAAYSDGGDQALNDPFVVDAFPYRAYYAIHDDRARPDHLKLEKLGIDGTHIYHRLDPVWQMFRPPWDWNCRCGWNPLTVRRAAAAGVQVAVQWLDTGVMPELQKHFVSWPPFLPSPSWMRFNPGIAA